MSEQRQPRPEPSSLDPFLASVLRICLAAEQSEPLTDAAVPARAIADWMEDPRNHGSWLPHPALLLRGLGPGRRELSVAARRRLDAAGLREQKRSSMAAEQAARLDALFEQENVCLHPVRGWHFAKHFYADPLARHSHALRWQIVHPADPERIATLLASQGWAITRKPAMLTPHKLIFAGTHRIDVELHARPLPWLKDTPGPATLSSTEFIAAELIGSALIEPHAKRGLWMVDLVHLLRRRSIDGDGFAEAAETYGVAGAAQRALTAINQLVDEADVRIHKTIDHLQRALTRGGGIVPADVRTVADIQAIQTMADTPRRRLLIKGLQRPDLLVRSQILRKDRLSRGRQAQKARQDLRDRHSANRR